MFSGEPYPLLTSQRYDGPASSFGHVVSRPCRAPLIVFPFNAGRRVLRRSRDTVLFELYENLFAVRAAGIEVTSFSS